MTFLCVLASNAALIVSFHWHLSLTVLVLQTMLPHPVDALTSAPTRPAFATAPSLVRRRLAQQRVLDLDCHNTEPDVDTGARCSIDEEGSHRDTAYTTALLKVAYDGTHFRGWTAGNSEAKDEENGTENDSTTINAPERSQTQVPKVRQSRRSRTLRRKGSHSGKVRTVSGTIKSALAKLYGNVRPDQITIESCSRTDAGVHATSLVAQFHCSRISDGGERNSPRSAVPLRPDSRDDASNFRRLPFESDLTKLVFVLNRMLPPDVRIVAASPPPRVPTSMSTEAKSTSFHPTIHTVGKMYAYKFAVGAIHDPLQTQYVWHLDGSSNRAVGMNGKRFRLERCVSAANLFVDGGNASMDAVQPRNYAAFRAAFRGTDRGRVQSTTCKLWRCEILQERREPLPGWETHAQGEIDGPGLRSCIGSRLGVTAPETFTVVIEGDRFLYKMVRNIVGTIVAVGCGHLDLEEVRIALETGKWGGNRTGSGGGGEECSSYATSYATAESNANPQPIRRICAPARGLTLVDVHYPEAIHFIWRTG